jgi:hypothetical protein
MSNYNFVETPWGSGQLDTDESATTFKKVVFGKVHSSDGTEWYSENLTSSFKISALKIMSGAIPQTAPITVAVANTSLMRICTGSTLTADNPAGGRCYCMMDSADATGRTWVTVLTGAFDVVSSRGTRFCSTGSDKDFILTDWLAPWHVTSSGTGYQARVYACWGLGSVATGPATISEISSSNKLAWTFDYEGGTVRFVNPTLTFSFENFNDYEDNVNSLSSYTDNGWSVLSQTKTTTEHTIVIGAGWLSGSTVRPFSDIITGHTGSTTGSCVCVEGYRYIGRSIYLG